MRLLLLCVFCLMPTVRAEPVALPLPASVPEKALAVPAQAAAVPLRARLDKETIRAAIADAVPEKDADPRRHEADTLSATPYDRFSKEFAAARLPACLHSDGLKYQPTFFLSGIIALPFVAVAKLRGVCR